MLSFIKKSNSFKILRVKVEGIWSLDHSFNDGLNAIIAANKHGKTTLIHLILATLGFSDKRKNEAKQNASTVYVEILVNGKRITVKMETIESENSYKTRKFIKNDSSIEEFSKGKAKKISNARVKAKSKIIFFVNFGKDHLPLKIQLKE